MMSGQWRSLARTELEQLSEPQQKQVLTGIEAVLETGVEHENVALVEKPQFDAPLWRLKVVDADTDTNHRVFIDLQDGRLVVLAVWPRETAYTPGKLERANHRR
jgi:mRNA-degrading endonuclease RelE of RelBE toxin-antitoxin system